ncbi:MAG: hypothetical protein J3K34DRAFT_382133 [Monoraphidium minutum]|nr:MAG: hypothetical protein J3K34DRAFT_382133 [Monoraphidium minutum]
MRRAPRAAAARRRRRRRMDLRLSFMACTARGSPWKGCAGMLCTLGPPCTPWQGPARPAIAACGLAPCRPGPPRPRPLLRFAGLAGGAGARKTAPLVNNPKAQLHPAAPCLAAGRAAGCAPHPRRIPPPSLALPRLAWDAQGQALGRGVRLSPPLDTAPARAPAPRLPAAARQVQAAACNASLIPKRHRPMDWIVRAPARAMACVQSRAPASPAPSLPSLPCLLAQRLPHARAACALAPTAHSRRGAAWPHGRALRPTYWPEASLRVPEPSPAAAFRPCTPPTAISLRSRQLLSPAPARRRGHGYCRRRRCVTRVTDRMGVPK